MPAFPDRPPFRLRSLVAQLEFVGVQSLFLVGHSMGGAVVSQCSEVRPERIRHAVYLAAFAPAHGQSVFQVARSDPDDRMGARMVMSADRRSITLKPETLQGIEAGLDGVQRVSSDQAAAPPGVERYDYVALEAKARELKAKAKSETTVTISAENNIPMAVLIKTTSCWQSLTSSSRASTPSSGWSRSS